MNFLDNPIFVKHLRSRLRRPQVMPAAVVVLVLCLCISYGGYQLGGFANGGAFGTLLGLQSIILAIIGASQVSTAVGGARESGILDFHRVSPLSPLAVTLGFFFGAPVREYLLFALTVPFTLICAANEAPSLGGLLQTMVVLFLGAWLLQALSLFTALSIKKPKGAKGIVGVFIFLIVFSGQGIIALSRASAFVGASPKFRFFGIELPWLVFVLLYGLPTLFFLLLASVRKMQSERAHAFTKPEALACLAVQATLILGAVWALEDVEFLTLIVLYLLVVVACVLTVTITPNLGEFTKGARRAERLGLKHLRYWNDLSLNRVTVMAYCLIVLAGSTVAWNFVEGPHARGIGLALNPFGAPAAASYSISIAVGVLTVAYVGLALQFFTLAAPKRGATLMGLFLFITWLVPGVLGLIAGVARIGGDTPLFISSFSPVIGIATAARLGDPATGSYLVQAAALGPAIVFAFLFNNLVTVQRRRALKQIHEGSGGPAKPIPMPDPLAV